MVEFLVLRGAPGSGKSTVAALLRECFADGITIEVDALRGMVHGEPWGSALHHGHAVGAAARLALHYRECGYRPVVIVDCLGGGSGELLLERLGGEDTAVFTLVAGEEVLRGRIRDRENHGFTDDALAIELNREMVERPLRNQCVIDTSQLSAQAVTDLIISVG